MAYSAVSSLKHTMERLAYSSPEIITPLYKEVQSLQQILKTSTSSTKMRNAIDERIREVVSKFEAIFESYVSDQIASPSKSCGNGVDLQNLKQEIDFFIQTSKKMQEEYLEQLNNPLPEEEEKEDDETNIDEENSEIVGLSDVYKELRDQLTVIQQLLRMKTVELVGMAGIGKTLVARKLFQDPLISDYFDCRAWVKVGRNCQLKRILEKIVAQLNSGSDRDEMGKGEEVGEILKICLKGKRFLIVLDDIWDTNVLIEVAKLCHYDRDGSRILLTSRLQNIGGRGPQPLHVRLLNKEESWDLLCKKVFAEEPCLYRFEKVGRKIAENCEGHPLTIMKVAEILSRDENRGLDFWNEVMLRKDHQVYIEAYEGISEVVFSSYDNLPPHLKACFLYMGVFSRNHEISTTKLIAMWIAEGFLEPFRFQELEHYSKVCLNQLVSHNLLMLDQQSSISVMDQTRGVKSCKLHSSVWYLCNREAVKIKFYHVLSYLSHIRTDSLKDQCRLCIHNSILFSNKDVHESIMENCGSTARSLLCFGPYSPYHLPICLDLKLLRVLNALTIRMYEFPEEVLELVQLRFLALTCDGSLPPSISKLWNLHFLIINRHLSISHEAPSYLPIEIWDMKGLKHVQIVGCNLQNPNGACLYFLDTLLNVGVDSCTIDILKAIPNLKKLGIQILAPDTSGSSSSNSSYFCHISHLHQLQTLKCVVVNPEFDLSPPPPDFSMLPSSLNKLSLNGFGYAWECMGAISMLPNLQVLKLRCYAFQGPKWEVGENEFLKLQFLTIEDTDLEQWIVGNGSFPWLCCLSLEHCYNLEEIKWEFESGVFRRIEIVDCNSVGVRCLEQIREGRLKSRHYVPGIFAHSSWLMGKEHNSLDYIQVKRDTMTSEKELEIFWTDFEKNCKWS